MINTEHLPVKDLVISNKRISKSLFISFFKRFGKFLCILLIISGLDTDNSFIYLLSFYYLAFLRVMKMEDFFHLKDLRI